PDPPPRLLVRQLPALHGREPIPRRPGEAGEVAGRVPLRGVAQPRQHGPVPPDGRELAAAGRPGPGVLPLQPHGTRVRTRQDDRETAGAVTRLLPRRPAETGEP